MTEETSTPTEMTNEQRMEILRGQLFNVEKTKRIYQNIVQLIAQSTYRGEVAGAVHEAITHAQQMASNLEAQERDLKVMLTPPPAPAKIRPQLVPAKKKKGKK